MEKKVPIISLEEIQQGSERVREVCKQWGCFRLTNHGVSSELMADMKSTVKALFFNRPAMETNHVNKDDVSKSGKLAYVPTNPLYEAIGLNGVACAQSVSSFCSDLHVSPQQREIIEKYSEAINKLGSNIASKIAANMGEPKEEEEWTMEFRLNKYNFSEETIGSIGVEVHTDATFLTLLQDDEIIRGLEVMDPSGSFVAVQPLPNALFVNIGDIAVVWSNGELRNVEHRVRCKEPGMRYSMAKFIFPPPDKVIEPQACFLKAGEHPRYPPITNRQYRKLRDLEKLNVGQGLHRICLTK